jgi:hypothetical protein
VTGTPEIALPLPGNDGQKRYLLGQVEVVPSHLPDRSFFAYNVPVSMNR